MAFPRDPRQIIKEIDLAHRVKEIREWADLSEGIRWNWWEIFLLAGLFCFSLGSLVMAVKIFPDTDKEIYWFNLFWTFGLIIMVVLCIEFLIRKFRVMRGIHQKNLRRLDRLEREVSIVKRKLGEREKTKVEKSAKEK